MITVRMFCDWGHNSSQLIELLMAQTETQILNGFGDTVFVDGNDYDYAMVFNFALDEVEVSPERRIGLVLEPREILNAMYQGWWDFNPRREAKAYYSFTPLLEFDHAPGIGFATAPIHFPYPKERQKRACMVVSTKTYTKAQQQRRRILQALLDSDLDIDFYGRGMELSRDPRVKGEIAPGCKHATFSNYEMVIDFENDPAAVTDKFFDPIISGCTPVSNNTVVSAEGWRYVDINHPVNQVVADIRNAVEAGPLDTSHLRTEIVSGSMSLASWINDKVTKLDESTSTR